MKKTIVLSLVLLFATTFNHSFGRNPGRIPASEESDRITTLIINANVTVVLVDDEKARLEVTGLSSLRDFVTFKQIGDTLVIGSLKKRNLTEAGTIYVPAGRLKNIWVNSDAEIRSLHTLQIPKLDIVFNGACHFEVATVGELNLIETDNYAVESNKYVRQVPASFFRSRKY